MIYNLNEIEINNLIDKYLNIKTEEKNK